LKHDQAKKCDVPSKQEENLNIIIVTHMPIDGKRLDKYIPKVTLSNLEGHPLLGNGPINAHYCQERDGVLCGVRAKGL
jgi:hypothetical protein